MAVGFSAIAYFYYKSFEAKHKISQGGELSAEEFNNVLDIDQDFVYTRDGQAMIFLKITPISIELETDKEKELKTHQITSALSGIDKLKFDYYALSRPVDISGIITEYQELLKETTHTIRRELIKKEIEELADFALSGEIVERQFFLRLVDKDTEKNKIELKKRAEEIKRAFSQGKVELNNCSMAEKVMLGKMVAHPQYVHIETSQTDNLIPMLTGTR